MPTPVYDKALLRQAMDAFNNAIRAGYKYPGKPSALNAGAAAIGLHAHTFRSRVLKAMEMGSLVDDPPPEPPPIIETIAKPRVRIKASSGSDAPIYRVIGIGDAHDHPGLPDKSRFKWLAKFAAEMKPDMSSRSETSPASTVSPGTRTPGVSRRNSGLHTWRDMESLEAALRAFYHYGDGLPCIALSAITRAE
jgi:hypothetical protein